MNIQEWKADADLMLRLIVLHDMEFRRTYKGKRTDELVYEDGRWFCDEMLKSRKNIKEVNKIIQDGFLNSPFITDNPVIQDIINSLNC